jgi:hypothetical protein
MMVDVSAALAKIHEVAADNSYFSYAEIWSSKDEATLRRILPMDEIVKLCDGFTMHQLKGSYPYRTKLCITSHSRRRPVRDPVFKMLVGHVGKHKIEEVRVATDIPQRLIPDGYELVDGDDGSMLLVRVR